LFTGSFHILEDGYIAVHGVSGIGSRIAVFGRFSFSELGGCKSFFQVFQQFGHNQRINDVLDNRHLIRRLVFIVHVTDVLVDDVGRLDGYIYLQEEVLDCDRGKLGGSFGCPVRGELLQHGRNDCLGGFPFGQVGHNRCHELRTGKIGGQPAEDLDLFMGDVVPKFSLELGSVNGCVSGIHHRAISVEEVFDDLVVKHGAIRHEGYLLARFGCDSNLLRFVFLGGNHQGIYCILKGFFVCQDGSQIGLQGCQLLLHCGQILSWRSCAGGFIFEQFSLKAFEKLFAKLFGQGSLLFGC